MRRQSFKFFLIFYFSTIEFTSILPPLTLTQKTTTRKTQPHFFWIAPYCQQDLPKPYSHSRGGAGSKGADKVSTLIALIARGETRLLDDPPGLPPPLSSRPGWGSALLLFLPDLLKAQTWDLKAVEILGINAKSKQSLENQPLLLFRPEKQWKKQCFESP